MHKEQMEKTGSEQGKQQRFLKLEWAKFYF